MVSILMLVPLFIDRKVCVTGSICLSVCLQYKSISCGWLLIKFSWHVDIFKSTRLLKLIGFKSFILTLAKSLSFGKCCKNKDNFLMSLSIVNVIIPIIQYENKLKLFTIYISNLITLKSTEVPNSHSQCTALQTD